MEERRPTSTDGPAWKAAERFGIDMSLLELSLQRTPLERLRVHSRALAMLSVVKEAAKQRHA